MEDKDNLYVYDIVGYNLDPDPKPDAKDWEKEKDEVSFTLLTETPGQAIAEAKSLLHREHYKITGITDFDYHSARASCC